VSCISRTTILAACFSIVKPSKPALDRVILRSSIRRCSSVRLTGELLSVNSAEATKSTGSGRLCKVPLTIYAISRMMNGLLRLGEKEEREERKGRKKV
jgi:hypothetical protein